MSEVLSFQQAPSAAKTHEKRSDNVRRLIKTRKANSVKSTPFPAIPRPPSCSECRFRSLQGLKVAEKIDYRSRYSVLVDWGRVPICAIATIDTRQDQKDGQSIDGGNGVCRLLSILYNRTMHTGRLCVTVQSE